MTTTWHEQWGQFANSDNTLECVVCGYTLIGDDPTITLVCMGCWNGGQILSDRVVCNSCAYTNHWWGTKTSVDTHPDGFTCDNCNEDFYE